MDLVNPAWGRVFIEVSFDHDKQSGTLAWQSSSVKEAFVALAGFDPARMQFAEFSYQHESLNAARELEFSLHNADEIYQLDGKAALFFAQGWMASRDIVNGSTQFAPSDTSMLVARAANAQFGSAESSDKENFKAGFMARLDLGREFVA